ncbi:MAG: lysylphosphatidylglycerol synthase transmembrane domain-containing protein [Planctomycetota bacterium]
MRRHWVTVLKLLLVAALMAFVFANVQWKDSVGRGAEVTEGKIVGPWDGTEVQFRRRLADGSLGPEESITPSPPDVVVSPGFPTYLVNLDWAYFAIGALCYAFSVVFAGSRWWWLLRVNELRVSWLDAQRFTWIGTFFNNIVPGQTGGDLVKAIYIVKHSEGGRVPALVSVLVDRILGLGSLALLGAIMVLFTLDRPGFDLIAYGIWGVLGIVAVAGLVAFSKRLRRLVHLDDLLNLLPAGLSGILKRVDQAVYFYRGHKGGIGLWLLLGMLNHVVSVTSVMLVGRALGVGMADFDYFVLVPVIQIVSAFPIGPNGWGVGEALYRYLFGEFGAAQLADVPRATATFIMGTRGVALSVLYRIHLTLWSLLGGLLILFGKDRVTREDLEQEVDL